MTPGAGQRAPFQENRRPDSRAVMDSEFLDVEDYAPFHGLYHSAQIVLSDLTGVQISGTQPLSCTGSSLLTGLDAQNGHISKAVAC